MRKTFYLLLAVVSLVFFSSCGNNPKKSAKKSAEKKIEKEEVKSEIERVVYPLPTPFEITDMLNRIEASYIFSLTNPPENVDRYITEKEKALALGVYSADLSYSSTYNQKQRILEFMNVSKKLLEELDIASAVDPNIMEELENAGNDKDKIVDIITNSFYSTYNYLIKNDRAPVSFLIMAGSWIEGLYIATHISEETFDNKEMVTIIMNQKDPLIKLMGFLQNYKSSDDVASVIDILTPLFETYGDLDKNSITKDQMMLIAKYVNDARNKILK